MGYDTSQRYTDYVVKMQAIADLKYAAAVLQWDQETYMPAKGAEGRARQLATLSELAHQQFTSAETGGLLHDLLATELDEKQQRNVARSWDDYSRLQKLPSTFVRQLSEAISAAFYAWLEARKQNSFSVFEPQLTALVGLKRQEAELYGYAAHPYDALMNEYEKGATVAEVDNILAGVKAPLYDLLQEVRNLPTVDDSFMHRFFQKDKQWEWGMHMARQLGFDFAAGRQDISVHPFTTNFSSHDVRITTRIDEYDFANMTWSSIHEVGHALYEQGLPAEQYGLPLGEYASLSIHESQSRLWENCVGRGEAFWQYYLPVLKQYFPEPLHDVSHRQFMQAINKVQPSLIRTEADELTYHFHVMVRYELEKKLIEGTLQVKDIPAYWNEQYLQLLGVAVPDDLHGCLQDVHWSHGSFGYFATYSLGSFYAAQFWQQAQTDLPNLKDDIQNRGDTSALLQWLRTNIHQHGRMYTSNELCQQVTGKKLDSTIFIEYLRNKLYSMFSGKAIC